MTRNTPVPALSEDQKDRVRTWVIHQDASVIGFNKPTGVPVQTRGNRGESLDHLLWAFARSNGKRPRLVHRIDADTSGVLVVARTHPAAAHLSDSFAERRAAKTYLALVRGTLPTGATGRIDVPIARRPGDRGGEIAQIVEADAKGAKTARTEWRVISRNADAALMTLRPETGRMHQIRVHLAHLGCPILGDRIYGAGALSAKRCMLHAARLVVPHPEGGQLDLSAPVPDDFLPLAQSLGIETDGLADVDMSA